MRRKLTAIIAATVLALTGAAATAPAAEAQVLFKCQKWNWWSGWRVVYTDDWQRYQGDGWQCYCIGQYP